MPPIIDATVSDFGAYEPAQLYGAHLYCWGGLAGALILAGLRWLS